MDSNTLIFEGNYLNGKRNGKGTEYFVGAGVLCEGDFVKGLQWDGKGYSYIGKLVFKVVKGKGHVKKLSVYGKVYFEGEYVNGKKHGKGKEYNYQGKLIFEGEFLNGKKNGKGKEYYLNGNTKFEGIYYWDMKNGRGRD